MAKACWVSAYRAVKDAGKLAAYAALAGPAITAGGGRSWPSGPFADRKDAGMTETAPRLVAWRERVGQRVAVRKVVGPMMKFLASQGRPVPRLLQSHLST